MTRDRKDKKGNGNDNGTPPPNVSPAFDVPSRPPDCFPIYDPEFFAKREAARQRYGCPRRYCNDFVGSYGKSIHYGQAS